MLSNFCEELNYTPHFGYAQIPKRAAIIILNFFFAHGIDDIWIGDEIGIFTPSNGWIQLLIYFPQKSAHERDPHNKAHSRRRLVSCIQKISQCSRIIWGEGFLRYLSLSFLRYDSQCGPRHDVHEFWSWHMEDKDQGFRDQRSCWEWRCDCRGYVWKECWWIQFWYLDPPAD